MNEMQAIQQNAIAPRVKEADLYRSMGLLEESLGIYEQILSDTAELDSHSQVTIEEKIGLVRKEMALEQDKVQEVSQEDIPIIREILHSEDSVPNILDNASALKELGLYGEAVAEYRKLFTLGCPPEEITPHIAECLLRGHSPSQIPEIVERVVSGQGLGKKNKALITFLLGLEMERRENRELALALYEAGKALDSENHEIRESFKSLRARLASGSRYDYLVNRNKVDTEKLQKALSLSKQYKKSVEWVLIEKMKINREEVGKSLSLFYGCPFRTYEKEVQTPFELLSNLKKTFLLHELWVPLSWENNGVEVLINDPRDLRKTDNIKALLKTGKISFSVAIREDIEAFIKSFFSEKPEQGQDTSESALDEFDLIPDISFEEEDEEEEAEEERDEASGHVVKLVDQVLVGAFRKGASDIHVEPSPITKTTSIRFRMDGVCQEYLQVPNSMARGFLARLKIMSGLDIAERRLPQDGKIKFKRKGVSPFELRLATLPTAGGYEDAVLRILAKAGAMKLDEMGLNDRNLDIMRKIIAQPYGLVLVVGPTGSGKTTSLHAALGHINKPGIKIWTAEDPVEISQPGLRQVEARPKIGLDFARIMRAFLRADPDVIMIGEMRDHETAAIGVEASLTGHLVFSTLHTNSAPETVTRLLDMELNPLNFSDAFLGVMAQRLVRRLCTKCREAYHPSEEEYEDIVSDFGREHFSKTGIQLTPDLKLYRPAGCEECSGTGYRGRLGIHELMEGTAEIKKMIKNRANSEALFAQSIEEGMMTLKQDGICKVFQGLTDIDEVRRVCMN
jgi:type II secretory ATPase GspE/PulE/Tfp pilus assembly ATPase PilB-like protein